MLSHAVGRPVLHREITGTVQSGSFLWQSETSPPEYAGANPPSMIPTPTQLLSEIEDGQIPLAEIFAKVDCDSLLEQRDLDPSFAELYREYRGQIEKLKFILNRDPAEKIRKRAFFVVSNATEQHEIASFVSDDFDLIAWQSHMMVEHEIPAKGTTFADWLYSRYKAGAFPVPPFTG